MKKIFFLVFSIIAFGITSNAQNKIDFGVKAGLNYNSNGKLIAIPDFGEIFVDESKGRIGFHFGIWLKGKIPFLPLYVQPEILYTQTKSTYTIFPMSDYILQKIDIPIIIGTKIFSFGRVFVGPSFQFIFDSDFENVRKVDTDSFSLGMQLGIGIELGKLGFDIRWERGLSKTESSILNNSIVIDSRPSQLIFSLSYRLNNKGS